MLCKQWICLAILAVSSTEAVPYKPAADSEVLQKLPRVFFAGGQRASLSAGGSTNTASEALALANAHITAYRAESEPRHLGYAQALLQPWWTNTFAPSEILVARATIKQSLHDFEGALRDLEPVLTEHPDHAQSLLLRTTILQVQGRYPEARAAAARLLTRAPRHVAVTALANVTSVNGEALKSYNLLAATVASATGVSTEERVWMLTLLAEIAMRRGDKDATRRHFTEALTLSSNDSYALAAYADFLLDQGEPQRAFDLVKDFDRIDGLLLRRALALQVLSGRDSELKRDIQELQSRFAAGKLRGDFMHQREEGRFTLSLLNQPVAALVLAQANWAIQREPADARLLLEAASAATNRTAAAAVLKWMEETRIEDKKLAGLAVKFQ